MSSHQGGEATNLRTQSVPALARVEAAAEAEGLDEVASAALAGWALASYTATHFEIPHPSYDLSITQFGPNQNRRREDLTSQRAVAFVGLELDPFAS